jgi:hypothetical protein
MGEGIITRRGGGKKSIKSIQSGEYNFSSGTSNDVSITSVDLTKSIIYFTWAEPSMVISSNYCVRAIFNSSTQINFSIGSFGLAIKINWFVVEYENVKSLQSGITTHSGGDSTNHTVTISSITTSKSLLFSSFRSSGSEVSVSSKINSATQLNFFKHISPSGVARDAFISYFVVEFE